MPPALIVALRHGEKDLGPDGKERKHEHGLNPAGFARAERLVTTLRPGSLLPDTAADPERFLVPYYDPGTDDAPTELHRPYQTVAPLAAALGTVPIAACPRDQENRLAGITLAAGVGTLVVCWEHHALVTWLRKLSYATSVVTPSGTDLPAAWDGHDFDTLWLLTRDEQANGYVFETRSQARTPGSSAGRGSGAGGAQRGRGGWRGAWLRAARE
jgi:hypothetical protein